MSSKYIVRMRDILKGLLRMYFKTVEKRLEKCAVNFVIIELVAQGKVVPFL